jgi:Rps23 Pro-64 3,4-dihydroxylase Tpa1-like proline 4-hydroxylase
MTQDEIAGIIAGKLTTNRESLKTMWEQSRPVPHFYLDDLLPAAWAKECFLALPDPNLLMLRDTPKEKKRVGVAFEKYHPLMKDALLAFQDDRVIAAVADITGIRNMGEDKSFYGSGISMMMEGDFLMPHLDNSHDGDGKRYRVINTLYYITPDWPEHRGGNLELWDMGMKEYVEIHSRFNRLVVMGTHTASLHSVNTIAFPGLRACVSNYYYSTTPLSEKPYVHKTTFFARPEDPLLKRLKFRAEGKVKNFLAKYIHNDAHKTKHRRDR